MKEKISITLNSKLIKEIDGLIDNIHIRSRSQAIESLIEKSLGQNKIAVFLTGGPEESVKIGEEFKPLITIKSKTIIEYAIKKLRDSDFKTLFIVGRRPVLTRIFEVIGDGSKYGIKVNFVEEDPKAKGTADTLMSVKGKVNSTFLVMYNDIIFDKENLSLLWESHLEEKSTVTLLLNSSSQFDKNMAGIVKLEGRKVIEFVEKPETAESGIFFASMFVAEPEIFEYGGNSLENDIFPELVKKGLVYGHLSSMEYLHMHKKSDIENIKKNL